MDDFTYRDGVLHAEGTSMLAVAEACGTPTYVYSRRTLVDHFRRFSGAFAALRPLVCFSAKALSNVHLLRLLAEEGAGIDAVSGGELHRALLAGVDPSRVVLAGVGKSADELREAVRRGVRSINVESESELGLLAVIAAEEGCRPRVAIRINPDVAPDSRTPARTTTGTRGGKFGVDIERAAALFVRFAGHASLQMDGFHVHLGSPIFDPQSYAVALDRVMQLVAEVNAAGVGVASINVGGGFPAEYVDQTAPSWDDFADVIVPRLEAFVRDGGQVLMEPGRTIAANAGILLAEVRYIKEAGERRVAVIDAGMTQMLRPAMYDSYQFMWPVTAESTPSPFSRAPAELEGLVVYDVVGPICESSDYLARERALPELVEGEMIAIFTVGAYGMTMASNYNSQPRAAEVLVDGERARLIRRRETYDDLVAPELSAGRPGSDLIGPIE